MCLARGGGETLRFIRDFTTVLGHRERVAVGVGILEE